MSGGTRWNATLVLAEIAGRHARGEGLSHSVMIKEDLPLLRAAGRYWGTWRLACEAAGLDYEQIRLYKIWTNEKIVEEIQAMAARGDDLSWRQVSLNSNPALAAAATKKAHFGSWEAALTAAGLDYALIRRYLEWDEERVLDAVRERQSQGLPLSAVSMEKTAERNVPLISAARRRFSDWGEAVNDAGIDYQSVAIRPNRRSRRTHGKGNRRQEKESVNG